MSISLTDDNIKWINNHPLTRKNIKEHIDDVMKYNNNTQFNKQFNNLERFVSRIDKFENKYNEKFNRFEDKYNTNFKDFISDVDRNVDRKIKLFQKQREEITNEINSAFTNRIINNDEYKQIYNDNLEKLKNELNLKGEVVLTSLINDDKYQHIADTHLETLSSKLENKFNSDSKQYNQKYDNIIKDIMDIKKDYHKEIEKLNSELKNYKNKVDSIESFITGALWIFGGLFVCYGFYCLLSTTSPSTTMMPISAPVLETMGSPILKIV